MPIESREFDAVYSRLKVRGRLARQWALVYAFAYREISNQQRFTESQSESVRKDPAKMAELHQPGSNPVVPTSIPPSMPRPAAGDGILNLSRTHSFLFQSAEHRVN
jgi:hypothetical protein